MLGRALRYDSSTHPGGRKKSQTTLLPPAPMQMPTAMSQSKHATRVTVLCTWDPTIWSHCACMHNQTDSRPYWLMPQVSTRMEKHIQQHCRASNSSRVPQHATSTVISSNPLCSNRYLIPCRNTAMQVDICTHSVPVQSQASQAPYCCASLPCLVWNLLPQYAS